MLLFSKTLHLARFPKIGVRGGLPMIKPFRVSGFTSRLRNISCFFTIFNKFQARSLSFVGIYSKHYPPFCFTDSRPKDELACSGRASLGCVEFSDWLTVSNRPITDRVLWHVRESWFAPHGRAWLQSVETRAVSPENAPGFWCRKTHCWYEKWRGNCVQSTVPVLTCSPISPNILPVNIALTFCCQQKKKRNLTV